MTQITPSLLAAAYASITVPNAPRANDLSVVGIAASDTPPVTIADTAFHGNASLSPTATLGGALSGATALAASQTGSQNASSVFSSGGSTAESVLGAILDTSA